MPKKFILDLIPGNMKVKVILPLILLISSILFGQTTNLDSLEHELSVAESAKEKLKISRQLAFEYCYKDSVKSFHFANNMIAIAKETDSYDYRGRSQLILAFLFKRYNNFEAAYDNFLQAIDLYKISGNREGLASCYANLSQMLEEQANYPKALEYIQLAFRMDSLENDKRGMGLDFNGIGLIFLNQSEFEKAEKYFLRTLEIGREIDDKRLVASSLSNLGILYDKLGDSERAIEYKFEVLEMYKSFADSINIGGVLNNIGHHHLIQKIPFEAIRYLNEAETIFKKLNDRRRLAEVWLNLGMVYAQLNRLGPALTYYEKGLKVAGDLGIKKTAMDCHKEISSLFAKQKKFKAAFQHHVKFKQMQDSIFNDENNAEILKLRSQLAIEQKEAENQKLREAQVRNENIIFRQRILGTGIIVGLLLLSIIALILYKAYRQKQSSNELLRAQQNEIRQKNEQLESLGKVKDKFLSVITHDMSEPLQNLKHTFELLEHKQDNASVPISIWLQLKNQIEGISDLSNKLLEWASRQFHGFVLNPEVLNLSELLLENLQLLSRIKASKNIQIFAEIPQCYFVYADYNTCNFIIRNLLSNALKFTPKEGRIDIGVKEKEEQLIISVCDNGIGMDENQLASLFTPNRVQNRTNNSEKGRGLGLIICKEFVEKNKGKIWAESKKGEGSSFHFSLPKGKKKESLSHLT